MSPLFSTETLTGTTYWRESRDGNPVGLAHHDDALFVWRKFIDASGQQGINCAVFRNEPPHVASEMILDAETWAGDRWPGERLYTYVNPARIRSTNPGYCFKRAGWRVCGTTRGRRPLLILEKGATS